MRRKRGDRDFAGTIDKLFAFADFSGKTVRKTLKIQGEDKLWRAPLDSRNRSSSPLLDIKEPTSTAILLRETELRTTYSSLFRTPFAIVDGLKVSVGGDMRNPIIFTKLPAYLGNTSTFLYCLSLRTWEYCHV